MLRVHFTCTRWFLCAQDRVPAFSAEKAQSIIETDLGRPVSELFRSFDPQPIAAASLGQVSDKRGHMQAWKQARSS